MLEIAVVILNYNGENYLKQFLPSVIEFSPEATIYVADNNSTDNSVAFLKKKYPAVKRLLINENLGFAGGYNKALTNITEKYLVLLNSDVEVTKNWIPPVISVLKSDDKIAACQPKIRDFYRKEYFEYAGAAGGFIDKYGYPYCRGRIFDTLEKDEGQYNKNTEVFWATGACLFIKNIYFQSVGGFDSDYFAHMEEIDLCWRLKNNGLKIMYAYESVVFHVGGGTLQKSNPHKTYLNFRNSLFSLVKNLPKNELYFKILIRLLLDGIAGTKFLLSGNMKDTLAIIKAHFSFYNRFSYFFKKRGKINPHLSKKLPNSIVFSYYLKQKKTFSQLSK